MNSKDSLTAPQQSFPAMNSPQRASLLLSPSGGGGVSSSRVKVALKPGRSLMDWMRLGKQAGKQLNGVQGKRLEVTEAELANHSTVDDGWLSIRGQVYNVTPYMEFHPGGAEELQRGLGKDATNLFNEVHRWVNVESMLEKCHIGPLQKKEQSKEFKLPDQKASPRKGTSSPSLHWPDTVQNIPWYMCKLRSWNKQIPKAKYDWHQMEDQVIISVYVKCQYFSSDCLIVDVRDKVLRCTLYLDHSYFNIHLELPQEVHPYVKVSTPKSACPRCDIWLKKQKPHIKWTTLGLPLEEHKKLAPASDFDACFRKCILRRKAAVTHDTYVFTFDLPEGTRFNVPLGHHVHLRASINGEDVVRPYTAVDSTLSESDVETTDNQTRSTVHLMIKIYPQGQFTPYLASLSQGDTIEMSNHVGNVINKGSFNGAATAYFIAAGTGFTPMIRLIKKGLRPDNDCKLKLLFFNKTQKDIIWREELEKCVSRSNGRFEVIHILSAEAAPSWTGHTGRIRKELVSELIQVPGSKEKCGCAICGPTPFMNTAFQLLLDAGFEEDCLLPFAA